MMEKEMGERTRAVERRGVKERSVKNILNIINRS